MMIFFWVIKFMPKSKKFLFTFILFLNLISLIFGKIINVNCNGSGDCITIQAGINAASDGDTVLVADGIYRGKNNKRLNWNGKIKHLVVKSVNGFENCIIDCEYEGNAFFFNETYQTNEDVIEGFTIKNGLEHWGGGIRCSNASPVIQSNRITNCEAGFEHKYGPGGGILLWRSSNSIIQNNIIDNNIASADDLSGGGGIACFRLDQGSTQPIIRNNVICNNLAMEDKDGGGGGIVVYISSPIIEDNLIYGNRTDWYGAGIHCIHGGKAIIRKNIISCNVSTRDSASGGGISIVGSKPLIFDNIITNNDDYGVYFKEGSVNIFSCDVHLNKEGDYCGCSPTDQYLTEEHIIQSLSLSKYFELLDIHPMVIH